MEKIVHAGAVLFLSLFPASLVSARCIDGADTSAVEVTLEECLDMARDNYPQIRQLGLIDAQGAIGIFTITPSEGAMIAADVASKAADVSIGFVDRFNGSLLITGDVAAVEAALNDVMDVLCGKMGFAAAPITRT